MSSYREVQIGPCRLINADCMDVLPTLAGVDAVVTDPPYGIGESNERAKSRGKLAAPIDYGHFDWDKTPASPEQIARIRSISKWQIIFGGNYFELPPAKCWLIWDKVNGDNDFADCELAWTNLKAAVRLIRFMWNGMLRDEKGVRIHPTQKPVAVMKWCIEKLPADCSLIVDPFGGSFSTAVACIQLEKQCIAIESDSVMFDKAVERVHHAYDLKCSELPFDPPTTFVQKTFLEVE